MTRAARKRYLHRKLGSATKELLRARGNLEGAGQWLAYCAQSYARAAAEARKAGIRVPRASWWVEVRL